ncbi:hypothetical protein JCM6882_009146 [Rhodosporidiobolus microsporus]
MSSASSLSDKREAVTTTVAQPLLDDNEHKKLLRRIDWRFIPWYMVTYCIMRIDVGNISNAGVMNSETGHSLRQTLGLTAQQWAWCLTSFYYTYMFVEPVSTYFIRLTTPSRWIARIMISWGIVMMCMAAVNNYGGLVATRVLVGLMEGGYFPCMIYHLSHWYTPFELAPRILALYAAASVAGAASGFLSWAISFANRPDLHPPMYGWRWLFLIEGFLPIIGGIATIWVLPDFPSTAKWLSAREVEHLALRMHKDAPKESGKTFDWKESLAIFRDPTWYLFTLIWVLQAVGGYGVSIVLPQVVKDMGFVGSASTNLLQIPPAAATIVFLGICSELLRRKLVNAFPLVIFMDLLVIAGYIMLQTVTAPGARYFAITLLTAAAGVIYPCLWPRRIQALRGTAGAALGIGLHNTSAQLSGILGPQLFRVDYAPRYMKSFLAASIMIASVVVLLIPLWWLIDGDISSSSWLRWHVQAQTHFRDGDDERDAKREAYKEGDVRREGAGGVRESA